MSSSLGGKNPQLLPVICALCAAVHKRPLAMQYSLTKKGFISEPVHP